MKIRLRACALTVAAATFLPATAIAAPVTVTLRIEGPDATLYEGPVTTDVRQFHFTGDPTSYDCNATVANGTTETAPSITAGAAVAQAIDDGLVATGKWYSGLGPGFQAISRVPVSESAPPYRYMVEYLNGKSLNFGICAQPVANGDEVLLAFAEYGTKDLLKLKLDAATAAPGATVGATVTAADGTTPVAGATVGGGTTDANGRVTVGPFTATGPQAILKATKTGWVRSNGGQVCVTDGADGACGTVKPIAAPTVTQSATTGATGCTSFGDDGRCGTPDDMPPLVRLTNLTSTTYTAATAPRELKGQAGNYRNGTTFLADPSGIKDVKLRITRYSGRKCWTFDGLAERFKPLKSCGTGKGKFFSIGAKAEWSYLLPATLKAGKYRVEAFAIDGKGNADKIRRWNRNHVVFRVK